MGFGVAFRDPGYDEPRSRARCVLDLQSIPDSRARHWTINGDFLGLKPTGVARFGRELTLALDRLVDAGHPLTRGLALTLVAPRPPDSGFELTHIPVSIVPELRLRLPQVWVQMQLPRHVRGGLLSFCNLGPVISSPHILCIHDLQTRTVPESYSASFRLAHRALLPALGHRAKVITTVSEFSKQDVVRFGIAPPRRVEVVYNGSDHARHWTPDRAHTPFRQGRPYVMAIGRNETHKNMELIWRLAEPLDELGIDIVLAGAFDVLRCIPPGDSLRRNIRCLGRIADDDLSRGFAEALCFLFPSRTEGFGLPAVEAMACGCPVIAAPTACLPEICGDAALFADPDDPEPWVEAIQGLRDRPEAQEELKQRGFAQAARYSWQETALRYLALMQRIDDGAA